MLPPDRPYSTDEMSGVATLKILAAAIEDVVDKKLSRRLTEGERDRLTECAAAIYGIAKACCERIPDPDKREGLQRRMSVMKINLGYVDKKPKEIICLSVDDASTLVGHALNYCEYECPCVTVDDAGERVVMREAVRRCALAGVYKRMMLAGGELSAECPYAMVR